MNSSYFFNSKTRSLRRSTLRGSEDLGQMEFHDAARRAWLANALFVVDGAVMFRPVLKARFACNRPARARAEE